MHPLLIVHPQPKGLAERKRPHSRGQIKKHSTMSMLIMPSLFARLRLWVTRGHFLHGCVHLLSSQCVSTNSDKGLMLCLPAAVHEMQRLMFDLMSCTAAAAHPHVRRTTCSLIYNLCESIPVITMQPLFHWLSRNFIFTS